MSTSRDHSLQLTMLQNLDSDSIHNELLVISFTDVKKRRCKKFYVFIDVMILRF